MEYSSLPKEPMMLLSFINTKLRDDYDSLAALCQDLNVSESDITASLSTIDYSYDKKLNRFI
jgi:transcriptional antiterminator